LNALNALSNLPDGGLLNEFLSMQSNSNIANINNKIQPDTLSEDSNEIHIPNHLNIKNKLDQNHEDYQSDNSNNKKRHLN